MHVARCTHCRSWLADHCLQIDYPHVRERTPHLVCVAVEVARAVDACEGPCRALSEVRLYLGLQRHSDTGSGVRMGWRMARGGGVRAGGWMLRGNLVSFESRFTFFTESPQSSHWNQTICSAGANACPLLRHGRAQLAVRCSQVGNACCISTHRIRSTPFVVDGVCSCLVTRTPGRLP